MKNCRVVSTSFEVEASSTIRRVVEKLHHLLTVEVDKIHREYLALLLSHIQHMNILLELSRKAVTQHTEAMQEIFRSIIERPVLEYSIETIAEGIRSKILVSEDLQRLFNISPPDFHLVFSMYNTSILVQRPIGFQLLESVTDTATSLTKHRKRMCDWLCRNCMTLNMHSQRNCRTCGFQPKDTQADL